MVSSNAILVLLQVASGENGVRSWDELSHMNKREDRDKLEMIVSELVEEDAIVFVTDEHIALTKHGAEMIQELSYTSGLEDLYHRFEEFSFPFRVDDPPTETSVEYITESPFNAMDGECVDSESCCCD